MFHIWWPATAFIAIFIMFTILIILMYGDRMCGRMQENRTPIYREPHRPSTSSSSAHLRRGEEEEGEELQYRESPPPQQRHPHQHQLQHQQQQQHLHQQQLHQQQLHHQYDYPPEHIEQYEEREVGGLEMQQQYYPRKTFSREAEV